MKTTFAPVSLSDKIVAGFALLLLLPLLHPQAALASGTQENSQGIVFQISTSISKTNTEQNIETALMSNMQLLGLNDIVDADPLSKLLAKYLEDKNSPLAENASEIVLYPNWKRALAISYVESHMCRFTPKYLANRQVMESYNCSGIGGDNFRRYESYADWVADMNNLLNQPNYINRPIEKFLRYYVQPGSKNWLYGVKKVEAELTSLENQAEEQRIAQYNSLPVSIAMADISLK